MDKEQADAEAGFSSPASGDEDTMQVEDSCDEVEGMSYCKVSIN